MFRKLVNHITHSKSATSWTKPTGGSEALRAAEGGVRLQVSARTPREVLGTWKEEWMRGPKEGPASQSFAALR